MASWWLIEQGAIAGSFKPWHRISLPLGFRPRPEPETPVGRRIGLGVRLAAGERTRAGARVARALVDAGQRPHLRRGEALVRLRALAQQGRGTEGAGARIADGAVPHPVAGQIALGQRCGLHRRCLAGRDGGGWMALHRGRPRLGEGRWRNAAGEQRVDEAHGLVSSGHVSSSVMVRRAVGVWRAQGKIERATCGPVLRRPGGIAILAAAHTWAGRSVPQRIRRRHLGLTAFTCAVGAGFGCNGLADRRQATAASAFILQESGCPP